MLREEKLLKTIFDKCEEEFWENEFFINMFDTKKLSSRDIKYLLKKTLIIKKVTENKEDPEHPIYKWQTKQQKELEDALRNGAEDLTKEYSDKYFYYFGESCEGYYYIFSIDLYGNLKCIEENKKDNLTPQQRFEKEQGA